MHWKVVKGDDLFDINLSSIYLSHIFFENLKLFSHKSHYAQQSCIYLIKNNNQEKQ